jgi:cytochrome c-type biogenesis protein
MTGAMTFAFGAGLLATVNPCGFVMLPGFIGMQLGSDGEDRSPLEQCAHGLSVGLVLSATFSGVLVLAGIVLAAGLRSPMEIVPWLALAVGAALAVAGVSMLAGRDLGFRVPQLLGRTAATTNGHARVAAFGAGYAIASLSCTLAVVLAVAGQATATANPFQFLAVFGAFAAGASSALLALSLSIAMASGIVARAMRRIGPAMHAIAGALLAASGAYLILYWLPEIVGDGEPGASVDTVNEVSSTVANFLTDHTGAFAIGLGLIVLLAVGFALRPSSQAVRRGSSTTD